jgi:hypothetical protein
MLDLGLLAEGTSESLAYPPASPEADKRAVIFDLPNCKAKLNTISPSELFRE